MTLERQGRRLPVRSADNGVDEHTALLATEPGSRQGSPTAAQPEEVAANWRLVVLCMVLLLCIDLGAALMTVPTSDILERSICRRLHDRGVGRPGHCKDPDVQRRLAEVRGWASSLATLPSLLSAVPYGLLADRYGRKPILVLSATGITLAMAYQVLVLVLSFTSVPDWSLIFTGLFMFIGGGPSLLVAMVLTIIAEALPSSERTAMFCRISALSLSCQMLGGPLSGLVAGVDLWLPIWIALGLVAAAVPLALMVPETAKLDNQHRNTQEPSADGPSSILARATQVIRRDVSAVTTFLATQGGLPVLLLAYAIVRWVDYARTDLLLQYVGKRFGWNWDKASYMASIGFLANLLVLLVIQPGLSALLVKSGELSPLRSTLVLCRGFGVALVAGCALFGLAPVPWLAALGLVPYATGQALIPLLRAAMNDILDDPGTVALLNTTMAVVEQISLMVGAPLASRLLSVGLEYGGLLVGLLYEACAVMSGFVACILVLFRA